jgi:hypothetical protein
MKDEQLSFFPGIPGRQVAKAVNVSKVRRRREYMTSPTLAAFKSKHLIYTHQNRLARPEWCACKIPPELENQDWEEPAPSDAPSIVARFGSGLGLYYAEGRTETLAVLNLCAQTFIDPTEIFK